MKKPSLLTLLLLISYPSVGAVLFTPALSTLAEFFHVSPGIAQLTVTLFLIGYALGQIPYFFINVGITLIISFCILTVFLLEMINSQNPLWMPILFCALLIAVFPLYLKNSPLKREEILLLPRGGKYLAAT
jgi:MFS family permease